MNIKSCEGSGDVQNSITEASAVVFTSSRSSEIEPVTFVTFKSALTLPGTGKNTDATASKNCVLENYLKELERSS